jgi:hypothetical protein
LLRKLQSGARYYWEEEIDEQQRFASVEMVEMVEMYRLAFGP